MKTFMNAIRVVVVAVLFVSVSALGFLGGCGNSCAPKRNCATGCKLQPEPVQIRKTCDHPGYYKQVCHLEYVPCSGKEEVKEAYPIYIGCYDEQGNRIDGNGKVVAYDHMGNSHEVAYTQNVDVQVTDIPAVYQQKGNRATGRNIRRAKRTNAARVNTVDTVNTIE